MTNDGCTQTTVTPAYDFCGDPEDDQVPDRADRADRLPQRAESRANVARRSRTRSTRAASRPSSNASTVAQVTFHLDHVFWESFVHDSPAHFDSFAAKYAGDDWTPTVTLEDFKGYAFQPFVDAQGHQVPWRSCVPTPRRTRRPATAR